MNDPGCALRSITKSELQQLQHRVQHLYDSALCPDSWKPGVSRVLSLLQQAIDLLSGGMFGFVFPGKEADLENEEQMLEALKRIRTDLKNLSSDIRDARVYPPKAIAAVNTAQVLLEKVIAGDTDLTVFGIVAIRQHSNPTPAD